MALDDGEQVIEIVRDAGRELANRFHLLRLAKLGLEVQALGNIEHHEQDVRLRRR